MHENHDEIILKPISEVAKFQKNLIPINIPDFYALKPMPEEFASKACIRKGIIAFRDFLLLFFDRLIFEGHLYAKSPKKPSSMNDYPFLHNITNLLVDIGYYGKLNEKGNSLLVKEIPSCKIIEVNGKKKNAKISNSSFSDCLRFLALCGFTFLKGEILEVSFPHNSLLLVGLKALSIADMEFRTERRYWNDNNLLRCDYRLLKSEETDMIEVLRDFLHPLSKKIQDLALRLHQRYTDLGLTCIMTILGDVSIAYANINKNNKDLSSRNIYQKRIWEFSYSIKNGFCLFVRAKKADTYADLIKEFPVYLQNKIRNGYGCDRKLRNERCQKGCQGISLPLDESLLDISNYLEIWLDNELPNSLKK